MLQIPEIIPFILSSETQDIASSYLGGNAKIGYVKIKKSYANKLAVRTYRNHVYIDDNEDKILKDPDLLEGRKPKSRRRSLITLLPAAEDLMNPVKFIFLTKRFKIYSDRNRLLNFMAPRNR